jgi:hypothetical protein
MVTDLSRPRIIEGEPLQLDQILSRLYLKLTLSQKYYLSKALINSGVEKYQEVRTISDGIVQRNIVWVYPWSSDVLKVVNDFLEDCRMKHEDRRVLYKTRLNP